jgi:hypothetical protein
LNDVDKKNANLERANRKLQDDIEDLNDRIANEGQSNSKLTKAKAKFETPHDGQTTSGEDTSLEVFPFYGVAVLRVDVLWRDYHVPLVPWVKVGLGCALWRASNTLGTSSYNSISGEGHSIGTHLALGLALNLSFFDPDTAREFDNSLGVNGTYLFAEYTREDLTGLGTQSDPMRVGGNEWTFGLAMEF